MCRRQDSYELVGEFAGKVYNRFILTRSVVARFAQFAYLRLCFVHLFCCVECLKAKIAGGAVSIVQLRQCRIVYYELYVLISPPLIYANFAEQMNISPAL